MSPFKWFCISLVSGRRDSSEDTAVQDAIRESLRYTKVNNATNVNNANNQRPPAYGWNLPTQTNNSTRSTQQQPNRLYPDIHASSQDGGSAPSAPPYTDNDDTPYPSNNTPYPSNNTPYPSNDTPYPSSNDTPYPSSNAPYPSSSNTPYPSSNNTPYPPSNNTPYPAPSELPEEAMRKARLRKFDKNN